MKEKIEAKKAEIANYERILRDYQSGRWMDMGRRHLASLKQELADMEASPGHEVVVAITPICPDPEMI